MATNAILGILERDGTVTYIGLHFGENVEKTLSRYETEDKVRALIQLGNLAELSPKGAKFCVPYPGEPAEKCKFSDFAKRSYNGECYLFTFWWHKQKAKNSNEFLPI
jgi:hypothetical protein